MNYQVVIAFFHDDGGEPRNEIACNVENVAQAEAAARHFFEHYQQGEDGLPLRVLRLDTPTPGVIGIFAKARTPTGAYIKAALRPMN